MDIQEYETIYHQIEEIIIQNEMGWILEEVSSSIREGKIVSIEESFKRQQEKPHRIKTEEYSAKEKLLLLLDALERAIINTLDLEEEVGNFIEKISGSRLETKINFYSEDEKKLHEFVFRSETLMSRQQKAKELQDFITNLRQEVEN